jgi:ribosomal-protein-alanine N-acetyltransferase
LSRELQRSPRERRLISRGESNRTKLLLAHLGDSDLEPFLAATRSSRRFHRPWIQPPTTRAGFEAYLAEDRPGTRSRVLLWTQQPGQPEAVVGYFSLGEIVRGALNGAYLGYWVTAAYAGRGLMTVGLDLALGHAFRGLRLHRVEANVQPGNAASLALAARGGFRHEGFSPRYLKIAGRWRDHERFAMTAEDWRARRATKTPRRR